MKRSTLLMLIAALGLAAGLAAAGCREKAPVPEPSKTGPAAGEIAQKVCPVMGGPIDPKIFVDYGDRRIYFCCPMCPAEFKKDPAKYLAKLDVELKSPAPAKAGAHDHG